MKFSTILLTAATLASSVIGAPAPAKRDASKEAVKLYVEAPGLDIDQQGLSPKHEGAGIDYIFLGQYSSEDIYYNKTSSGLFFQAGDFPLPFSVEGGVAQFTVAGKPAVVSFVDDYLVIDGSTHVFAACRDINDPYNYSKEEWALTYTPKTIPKECAALRIRKGY